MEGNRNKLVTWLVLVSIAWISPAASQDQDGCSFDVVGGEVSSCNLLMDMTPFAVASWRTGKGDGAYFVGGPPTDKSVDGTGGYAFTTSTDMFNTDTPHKKSWMLTNVANATGAAGRCLSFSHAMDGLSVKSLEVLLISYEVDNPEEILQNDTDSLMFQTTSLWLNRDITYGDWKNTKISFTAPKKYSLAFAAEPEYRYSHNVGYVSVDNITLAEAACDNDCNFDANFCTWTNLETGDDFDWSLGRSSRKRGTGPSKDQSSFLNDEVTTGGYAFIDSSFPRRTGDKAKLVSSVLDTGGQPLCLSFFLNIHGGGNGDIRVLYTPENNANETTELWKLWENDGHGDSNTGFDLWSQCEKTVAFNEPFRLIIEGTVGFPGAGDIGLDTIVFKDHPCPSIPSSSNSGRGDCTFLVGTCGWEMPPSDSSSCQMLNRVGENSYNPPGHTLYPYEVTDMYMKFDLGCYRNPTRDRAAMTIQLPSMDTIHCLSFWVYMRTTVATTMKFGALSVVLIDGGQNTTLWRLQNEQQAGWTYAQVSIPAGSSLTVAIEGTKGHNVIGMIGVDDITVFPSECEVQPPVAKVVPGDCTFDHGPCLYQIQNANLGYDSPSENWRFSTGEEVTVVIDHTFEGEGGFMFIDSFNEDLRSRLRSPFLDSNQTYCFTFYFTSFYQDNAAKLSVYRDTASTEVLLWQATQAVLPPRPTTSAEVEWHFAQVEIDEQLTVFQIIIEAEVRVGGWAIDDIKLFTSTTKCDIRPEAAAVP